MNRPSRCAVNKSTARGFTLIELMVVMTIVAFMAMGASVLFNRGGPDKDLNEAIENFVKTARAVGDLSIVNGEPMGLRLIPPTWTDLPVDSQTWQYAWYRQVETPNAQGFTVPQWVPLQGIPSVSLDPKINLFIRIEEKEWEWDAIPPSETPILVLLPSGEADPPLFEIEIEHTDISVDLEAQHIGLSRFGSLEWIEALEEKEEREKRFKK